MGRLKSAVLLILFPLCSVWAQTNALLVDTSKSMRPYYDAGLMKDLGRRVFDVLQSKGDTTVLGFSTNVSQFSGVDALSQPELGDWTYLDKALEYALRKQYGIVWLVTDNVQSQSNDPEAANTAVFYRALRSPKVRRVVVFPLRQAPGRSGLVVYALQVAPELDESFRSEVQDFLKHSQGVYQTEALHMKPLDLNTVELSFLADETGTKKRLKAYDVGQDIHEKFQARFKSRFEHLRIADAKVEVPPTKASFSESSLLTPEKREVQIDPQRVASLDPQSETENYLVTIDLGKLKLKKDPASLWKAAWGKNYEDVTLDVQFIVHVPQASLKFRDSFIRDFNAASPEVARTSGKVYGLDQLPILLSDNDTAISAKNTVVLRVQYPWWPAFLWLLLLIVALIAVGGLVVFVLKNLKGFGAKAKWEVTAQTIQGSDLKCEYRENRITVRGDTLGEVQSGKFFVPSPGVKLDAGADKARIVDGELIKILTKERPTILKFTRLQEKGSPSGSATTVGGAPGRLPRRR